MLKKLLLNISALLHISLAVKPQRTEGKLLPENEVKKKGIKVSNVSDWNSDINSF
jgi:hypothetical protein